MWYAIAYEEEGQVYMEEATSEEMAVGIIKEFMFADEELMSVEDVMPSEYYIGEV